MDNVQVFDKLNNIAKRLGMATDSFFDTFPTELSMRMKHSAFIAGGCIYSMFKHNDYKDIDIFFRDEAVVKDIEELVIKEGTFVKTKDATLIGRWRAFKCCVSNNAITIGDFQLIKKDCGEPSDVVSRFDFKHNMFWIENGRVHTMSNTSYLTSNKLVLNDLRPRQLAGVMVRIAKYTKRGMNISSTEMCKIILKLNEVGIEEEEMKMLNRFVSFES